MIVTGSAGKPAAVTHSPFRRVASMRVARETGLRAAHARFYVGTCAGSVVYRVSRCTGRVWDTVAVVYDPARGQVESCECEKWRERHVCEHAGAVYAKCLD